MFMAWISSIVYIRRKYPSFPFRVLPGRPDTAMLREILKIGLPLGFNHSVYTGGHIVMQSLINTQGSAFMAAASVTGKIMGVSSVAITSFSGAMSTFAGQNYGAGNYKRLRKGGRIVPLYAGLTTALLGGLMYMSAEPLIRLFTGDGQTIAYALVCIGLQLPFQWCCCVLNTILNLANGVGAVGFSTLVNILMLWAVRIPAAFMIARFYDGHYVTFGISISFLFGLAASLTFYRSKRWKEVIRLSGEEENTALKKGKK